MENLSLPNNQDLDLEQERINIRDNPEIQRILVDCIRDKQIAAKTFFPNRFRSPFARKLHRRIFDVLNDKSIQKAVIVAPRGIGKTSVVFHAEVGHAIMFEDHRFIVPISHSATHAIMQSESLKNEFKTNPTILKIFGDLEGPIWSKELWVTKNKRVVMPRGSLQQVRGLIYGDYRPDLLLIDDLEDLDELDNEDMRAKKRRWFDSDVMGAIEGSAQWLDKNYRIFVIGSMLHEDSIIANLMERSDWYKLHLELFDEDGHSNWDELIPDSVVAEKIDTARKNGTYDDLIREFRGVLINSTDSGFYKAMFQYYDETAEKLNERPYVENIVLYDPARTTNMTSDETAIDGVGVDVHGPKIFFRDCEHGLFHPDDQYSRVADMCFRIKARVVGVETHGLHEFITYPLINYLIKRGVNAEVIELKPHREDKISRVGTLRPYYRLRQIYHNPAVCNALEAQLMSYPRSKKWDIMDCFSYITQVLDEGNRFSVVDEDPETIEKEYKELVEADNYGDLKPLNNWRII